MILKSTLRGVDFLLLFCCFFAVKKMSFLPSLDTTGVKDIR